MCLVPKKRRANRRVLSLLIVGLLALSMGFGDLQTAYARGENSAAGAAPSNDSVSSPIIISSLPYTNTQSTNEATTSDSDPLIPCLGETGYYSVWYAYSPEFSAQIDVDTFGSDYDTVLAVYSYSGSLTFVECNDDTNSLQSALTFNAAAGETYYIEIAGYGTESYGNLILNVDNIPEPPPNDDVGSPIFISGLPYTNTQSTIMATTVESDPRIPCIGRTGYNSVWYEYTPGISGQIGVDTFGSDYDTVLAVYRYSGNLIFVACNDDSTNFQSALSFYGVAGVTYYIEITGFWTESYGNLTLNVENRAVTVGPMWRSQELLWDG